MQIPPLVERAARKALGWDDPSFDARVADMIAGRGPAHMLARWRIAVASAAEMQGVIGGAIQPDAEATDVLRVLAGLVSETTKRAKTERFGVYVRIEDWSAIMKLAARAKSAVEWMEAKP